MCKSVFACTIFCLSEPALQLLCWWTHRVRDQKCSGGAHPQRQRPGGCDHGSEQDHGTTFHRWRWGCESTRALMHKAKHRQSHCVSVIAFFNYWTETLFILLMGQNTSEYYRWGGIPFELSGGLTRSIRVGPVCVLTICQLNNPSRIRMWSHLGIN